MELKLNFYLPSCLGQETAKEPFGLRVKLPPAHLSTTHGGGFTLSLTKLNIKQVSYEYQIRVFGLPDQEPDRVYPSIADARFTRQQIGLCYFVQQLNFHLHNLIFFGLWKFLLQQIFQAFCDVSQPVPANRKFVKPSVQTCSRYLCPTITSAGGPTA